jgi:hypothetical protein
MKWYGDKLKDKIKKASVEASKDSCQIILDKSQDYVPVQTGALKASGHIQSDGDHSAVVYDKEYAAIVHETKVKFLEQAVKESEQEVAQTVAQKIKEAFK